MSLLRVSADAVPGLVYEQLGLRWQTSFACGPIVELDLRIQR